MTDPQRLLAEANTTALERTVLREKERAWAAILTQVSPTEYRITVPEGFTPNPFQRGRGIFHYDELYFPNVGYVPDTTEEQEDIVIVYNSIGGVIPSSEYKVDYINGRILNPTGDIPSSVTYKYRYVAVLDADTNPIEQERPIDLPYVVVSSEGQNQRIPLQLGGGKITYRRVTIYVYAVNQAERDDIVQTVMDKLEDRAISVIDFNHTNGLQLNYDGTYNSNYVPVMVSNISGCMNFSDVSYRHRRGTRDHTYGERYRSTISLHFVVHVE